MIEPIIDPARLDLAAEYRARPLGRHSPGLQALLDTMRRAENCQNLILVGIGANRWVLHLRSRASRPHRAGAPRGRHPRPGRNSRRGLSRLRPGTRALSPAPRPA